MADSSKIEGGQADGAILALMGERLVRQRIACGLTQAQLASDAGVAKRTVERVEAGESIQVVTLIRLCRVLGLLEGVDLWLPESRPSPMALVKESKKQKTRRRASPRKNTSSDTWEWLE